MISDNVSLLTTSGEPSIEELSIAWIAITQEYTNLVRTEQSDNILNLWNKIVHTECLATLLDYSLKLLKYRYDEEVANVIANAGYDLILYKEDRAEYLKQIYIVENESKTLVVLLNQYNNEYKILTKGMLGTKRTEADYEKEVRILSKFMGFRIVSKDVTVMEVSSIKNLYHESLKNARLI